MPPASLSAAAFEDVAFWDARYSVDDEAFDWYEAPSIGIALAAIERVLSSVSAAGAASAATSASTSSPRFSLLDIGCGTSLLAETIAERRSHLFNRIVACDASEVAIEKQKQRWEGRWQKVREEPGGEQPGASSSTKTATVAAVSYEVADAFSLPYGDASFDAVVDKGTADALDCGGCDGDDDEEEEKGENNEEGEDGGSEGREASPASPSPSPSPSSYSPAARVIAEATRVLKPGGVFVMVSCREPQRRRRDFAKAARLSSAMTAATSDKCRLSAPSLFLSSVVGEIMKGARDPCPNAHVYVGVKSRSVREEDAEGRERDKGKKEEAAAEAEGLADAAATAASAAATASAMATES